MHHQVYVHHRQSDYPQGRDEWHVTGQFLAVHRMYCYIFELMLRKDCQYRGPMPYWDELRDAGNFRNSEFLRDFGGPGDERGFVVGVIYSSQHHQEEKRTYHLGCNVVNSPTKTKS